ncbi:MAG: spermidine/putrescine ABC transporter substrate-binding protein, partial [Propionibacteriaceae bacterium]|nr:spermidine/putrescine ABC transporter substrate-binding protein [Propionibacteriaceae bacterium]
MAGGDHTRLRLLVWPGMPAPEALREVERRLGIELEVEVIFSNEDLEARMDLRGPYDLVCPSDYMVERLGGNGRLARLDLDRLPSLSNLDPWVLGRPHDPECARSVPLAFGTTGYLYDHSWVGDQDGWDALFDPMEGAPVGMLSEVREVIGAALIATGHSPNEIAKSALSQARGLLEAQAHSVVHYS